MSVLEEKKKLRAELKQRIAALTPDYIEESNKSIVQNILGYPCYTNAKTIFCFVGTSNEINTSALIEQALADGKRVAVPLCIGKGIMEAREIHSLAELHSGMMGILEPTAQSVLVTPAEIDFAVLPCVSCDRRGNRLGYGGGYYDRFLEKATFCSVLICREQLLCGQIPTEPHDIAIPAVITEAGCFSD
ncbi:5-formyltetrahydrofolate cyclo-ligase [Faecalispora anaeroviscerum]|uniref:5-formyltetrahydrofolate cyclo-ligase n=1 Tax=Faecalispora anaeroviscerum TaxID=2991836 RepID=UPI0024BB65CD|nr:5-formyltetrahydrofolate cyclo-ligase [Faecalispora anaeroviscerum]